MAKVAKFAEVSLREELAPQKNDSAGAFDLRQPLGALRAKAPAGTFVIAPG